MVTLFTLRWSNPSIFCNRSKWFRGSVANTIWDLHLTAALGVMSYDVHIIFVHMVRITKFSVFISRELRHYATIPFFSRSIDDYNWDWSLQHVSQQCLRKKLHAMVVKGPRVFHIGEWFVYSLLFMALNEFSVGRFPFPIHHFSLSFLL